MKKIAFITHSFHKKSNSVNILAEEIFNKEDFLVDYFYIEDWTFNATGLEHDIVGYDVVVIIQLISLEIISKIKCDNIVFIPMYDFSYSWNIFKWLECVNLKILSFTKKTHDTLCQMGLNSYYAKYYPESVDFIPGDLQKLFLWQRVNDINIKTTLKLLTNFPIESIHLHKAVDPYHAFVQPSQKAVKTYNIVFSDWFEHKNDYLEILKKVGIYMAPRLMEGGAAAFIDAMKMGKVVVANNNAAMNEYITHNETGLLYDAHNIKPIDFNALDLIQIQKNAYQCVKDGRVAWRKSIPNILNFIESKQQIIMSDGMLTIIRDSRELLRQEHTLLTERVEQAELKLKHDQWYNFGKASRKEKLIKILRIIGRKCKINVLINIWKDKTDVTA